uniref:Uncharacterized protein n=1 Tax=Rhizophora mucronata TaxID=61149 RepID=A0A2P2N776_RHIMU
MRNVQIRMNRNKGV